MNVKPDIPQYLLWEYDLETFNFDQSYKIVIERVLEMGNFSQWRTIYQYYGVKKINETIEWSAQLLPHNKDFSKLFLKSDFFDAA
jgi:hypothetical protein